MPFKANIHLAREVTLENLKKEMDEYSTRYDSKYPTPKYMRFMRELLESGWRVKLYEARVSKYVFVSKGEHLYKIRFSNHKPIYAKERDNDCDYYVGISHKQVSTTEKILSILKTKV